MVPLAAVTFDARACSAIVASPPAELLRGSSGDPMILVSCRRPTGHRCLRARVLRTLVPPAILAAAALSAHAAPLTFDDALHLAQERSRQLPAQDAAARAAREMAVAAAQRPDPVLKLGVDNLPVNGPDAGSLTRDFMTMRTIGVSQELTREDKRQARATRYEREADLARAGRELVLANLERDTAMAWLDRYYRERMRDVLVTQRDEARLQVEAAEAAYRGGHGSQADVFAARSAVAQLDDRLAQANRQVATAETHLARWIGEPAAQGLGAPPAMETTRLAPATLDTQLAHHPELAVMARQAQMAQADVAVAQANKRADWSVELMYSQRGPAYSNMVSVGVSVPLQWDQKNRQDREVAAKVAMVDQAQAQLEEATRQHTAEVREMLQEWQSDRERLARYDASLLPLAAQRTQAAVAAYRGNTGSLSGVLEARRAEIDTHMDQLRLQMDTARLWAQLNYLAPADHAATALHP
jgi:outer membrane protein TolC